MDECVQVSGLDGWVDRQWTDGWMSGGWTGGRCRQVGGWRAEDHRAGTASIPCLPSQDPAQEPPPVWSGARMLTARPWPPTLLSCAGGDRIHDHPVQLHVQQQLCGRHEPAAHPHHHHAGDPGVSLLGTWVRAAGVGAWGSAAGGCT